MKRPSKTDPSRPRRDGYEYKKRFYRSPSVASDYDFHRFGSRARRRRNTRKWSTIVEALEETTDVKSILDLPCGTGRFTARLAERGYLTVASDISMEMMKVAEEKNGTSESFAGYVQADAEAIPLRDASLDCVMCIRFMFHLDSAARIRVLREMARVSRRWLIVDYRHRYSLRYAKWRVLRALGLSRRTLDRISRAEMEREFQAAGVAVRKVIPVARAFSDKWIVVGESRAQ